MVYTSICALAVCRVENVAFFGRVVSLYRKRVILAHLQLRA